MRIIKSYKKNYKDINHMLEGYVNQRKAFDKLNTDKLKLLAGFDYFPPSIEFKLIKL